MRRFALGMVLVASTSSMASAQSNTGKGAALGGVAGAVVGGIIGHQNDETPEGALIGGAVGAIAGGVIGHHRDEQIQRERQYQYHAYQQRQAQQHTYRVAEQSRRAVSIGDAITMTRSGLSESIIVSHIEANGVQRRPEVSDVINMHQQGVSEYVISAMQRAPIGGSYPTSSTTVYSRTYPQPYNPGTVIVHEHVSVPTYAPPPPTYVPAPSYYAPPRTHYHSTYGSPRRGF